MKEIWIPIKGFEGKYEISNMGRVKSLPRKWVAGNHTEQSHGEIILTPPHTDKYLRVILYDGNGKRYRKKIHKMVAEAFLEKPEEDRVIDHINGIKTDNRATNLRWVTHYENSIENPNTPTTPNKPIQMESMDGQILKVFHSINQAAKEMHLNQANITHALTKRYKHCGGYKWNYVQK